MLKLDFSFNILIMFSGLVLVFDFSLPVTLLCHLLTLNGFKLKTDIFHTIKGLPDHVIKSFYNLQRVQFKVV